jgi:mRNA interferase MazF
MDPLHRGEVYMVEFDPVVGSETGKTRPAIVIQNDLANRSSPTVTVIPMTSKVTRVFPFQVRIEASEGGLERTSKALCEQVRTVSRSRFRDRLGSVSDQTMSEIRKALDRHLWF